MTCFHLQLPSFALTIKNFKSCLKPPACRPNSCQLPIKGTSKVKGRRKFCAHQLVTLENVNFFFQEGGNKGTPAPESLARDKGPGDRAGAPKITWRSHCRRERKQKYKGQPPHPLPSLLMALHSWGYRDARAHRLRRADRRAIAGCAGRGPGRRRQALGPGETPLASPPCGLRARANRGSGREQR